MSKPSGFYREFEVFYRHVCAKVAASENGDSAAGLGSAALAGSAIGGLLGGPLGAVLGAALGGSSWGIVGMLNADDMLGQQTTARYRRRFEQLRRQREDGILPRKEHHRKVKRLAKELGRTLEVRCM